MKCYWFPLEGWADNLNSVVLLLSCISWRWPWLAPFLYQRASNRHKFKRVVGAKVPRVACRTATALDDAVFIKSHTRCGWAQFPSDISGSAFMAEKTA